MTESKTFVKMEHGDCESDPDAAVAQSVERHIGNVEVTGSIPVSSSCLKRLETFCFKPFYVFGDFRNGGKKDDHAGTLFKNAAFVR